MFLNEDFLRFYEELSKINNPLTEGNFDNEEIYGEAAKTIPGLLRYFVAHIETLGAVIERERILASTGESKKASDGMINGKKLPFVSFSHQLFSHAYRIGSSWKYGIVVDQNKLEQKVQTLSNTNIEDNYVHENKSSKVFGAAKLSNGSEVIMTSYGQFEINLDDTKRKALGDLQNTGYYEKVKDSFNTRLAAEQAKYEDNHAKSVTAESFYCTEVPEVIKRYLKTDVEVLEGFLLVDRRQATGVKFTDICSDIPGLFDYLQNHTTLNEGELRVWLPKGEKYLDISGCIVGVVLPSNYKENNLDDETNKATDVVWLRKLIKEKDLTIYVYKSNDTANIPSIDTSNKLDYKQQRQSLVSYFHQITSSREAAVEFIANEILPYQKLYKGYEQAYGSAVAKHTTIAVRDLLYLSPESPEYKYGYQAFLKAILEHDITEKDIMAIRKTGQPLKPAYKAFEENTSSKEAVQVFVKQLIMDFPNFSHNLRRAYNKWFVANTNALRLEGQDNIIPEEVSWKSFAELCLQKFNYTVRDLSLLAAGEQETPNRKPIKELFKLAIGPDATAVKKFIKRIANYSAEQFLNTSYERYLGYFSIDSSSNKLRTDSVYGYKSWLEKVTDPNGPVKLTKEELLAYFKECRAAA